MDEERIDLVHYCEKGNKDNLEIKRDILCKSRINRIDNEPFLREDSFVEIDSKMPAILPFLIVCVIFLVILLGFLLWKLLSSFLFH